MVAQRGVGERQLLGQVLPDGNQRLHGHGERVRECEFLHVDAESIGRPRPHTHTLAPDQRAHCGDHAHTAADQAPDRLSRRPDTAACLTNITIA